MGKSNIELLKIAEKYLGYGGSVFRKFCGLPSNAAYCAAFVSYIFNKGDDSDLFYGGKRVAYCPYAKDWCDNNLANIPIYLAMPMDIVLFDWNPETLPDHIGFAVERISDQEIRTIEGNTNGGVVAYKKRTVPYICGCYRPHFKPASFSKTKKLEVDGAFGYSSIAILQKWLGVAQDAILKRSDVKALQKKIGVAQDGSWGTKTSKALQKLIGVTADGYFGEESVKAFQTYLNKVAFTAAKPTKAQKINNRAVEYAWPKGTKKAKYAYDGGAPTTAFKKAWKKYYPDDKNGAGCHQSVLLVLRSLGYASVSNNWTKILAYLKKNFKQVTFTRKLSQLKAGDIWLRRDKKNGKYSWHIMFIVEVDGKLMIAESQQGKTYFHINTNINKALTKHDSIWLFRAK